MHKGFFLFLALFFAVAAHAAPPNLVLIVTDDQGYPDLSVNGNPYLSTPHIERIAREGVTLQRFYVSPVCSPTRASLMTGRYNYRTGVVDTYLGRSMMHASEVTLAERLRAAGYHTGIFGKWHLGDTYPLRAMDQGFDEALVCRGGGVGQPSDPPGNSYFSPRLQHNGNEEASSGYCSDVFTGSAIGFMHAHKDEPFFVYLPFNAPHAPLQVEERYVQPFRDKGLDEDTARLYGMVVNLDENVGKVLDALRELGVEDRTLTVFMTDNGAAYDSKSKRYAAGLRGTKGTPYEGGIHVPCFLRWPGRLDAGKSVSDVVAHIDLSPTFLEALDIALEPGAALDGRSIWPLLSGRQDKLPERALYFQWHRGDEPHPFENCAVVENRYKLVNGKELYDLSADPGETTDLAAALPGEVARMRSEYEAWLADVSSTRGYAPPRILLSPPEAPVTLLTPQDWRGTQDFGASNHAYWEVTAETAGAYRVELDFGRTLKNAVATIQIAGMRYEQPVPPDATSCIFQVTLPAHLEDRLAFEVSHGNEGRAVQYVRVSRNKS